MINVRIVHEARDEECSKDEEWNQEDFFNLFKQLDNAATVSSPVPSSPGHAELNDATGSKWYLIFIQFEIRNVHVCS